MGRSSEFSGTGSDRLRGGIKMPKRKPARTSKLTGRSKTTKAGRLKRAGKKTTRNKKLKQARHKGAKGARRRPTRGKSVQPRVWRRTARLADDALEALQEGHIGQARQYLEAIRAVAQCADEQST
jgi:hypothetical protein